MNYAVTLISNTISYICLTALVTSNDVLQWVYTIVFAISVIFPIVWNIVKALKDKEMSKEEYDDIQKELDDAKKKLEDYMNSGDSDDDSKEDSDVHTSK